MGVSADHPGTLEAYTKDNQVKHLLLSDFPRRQMLTAWGALETNQQSPLYHYAKRAYFIIDRQGTVKYVKVQQNALDLLDPAELLQALKASGA